MPTQLLADVRKRLRSFSTKTTKNDPDDPNSKLQLFKNHTFIRTKDDLTKGRKNEDHTNE